MGFRISSGILYSGSTLGFLLLLGPPFFLLVSPDSLSFIFPDPHFLSSNKPLVTPTRPGSTLTSWSPLTTLQRETLKVEYQARWSPGSIY